MTRKLALLLAGTALLFGLVWWFRAANIGTQALWTLSEGGQWLLPLIVVAALIDSINPCAFSVLLLTIVFVMSVGKLRSGVLAIGGAYILGIFAVYLVIGLGLLQVLHLFDTPHFMAKLGASLLIALGLVNITKEVYPAFPLRLAIPQGAHPRIAQLMERATLPSAVALGALVGLCEFPCTGGPYLMVLGLLHDRATYYTGAAYLLLYNLVFVLPLVLILLVASDRSLLARVQAWQKGERRTMRIGGGLAMVALGAAILAI